MIRKVLFTFITLSLLVLGGCSDDDIYPIPGADGRTTLNLLIPTTEMAYATTRAERNEHSDKLATEGHFENISVIGFYKDNDVDKHFFAELTSDMATSVDDVYKGYKLAVVPAQYTLYVLANINIDSSLKTLLDKKSLTTTEMADLKTGVTKMTYAYNEGSTGVLPTPAGGLPMAKTMTADLREGENKNVVIPLKFVCAKVRLTVIYNQAFGTDPFRINGLDVTNFYSPTKIFVADNDHGTGNSRYSTKVCDVKEHYGLTSDEKTMTLDDWMDTPIDQSNNDKIDNITSGKTALSGDGFTSFCWQETAYIPEAVGTTTPTTLTLKTSKGDKTINIGCDTPSANHTGTDGGKIERGNFYDIIAMVEGGNVTVKWKVQKWETEQMAVRLAGLSNLYLNETHIALNEENALSGENPIEIAYQSRAPIDFDIPEVEFAAFDGKLKLFEVENDADNQVIRVKLNSKLPQTYNFVGNLQDEFDTYNIEGTPGFWVVSGNIRKWVQVDYVDCSTYVRILPKTYDLAISNIANRNSYTIYLDYATNDNNLTLKLTDFENNNSSQASTSDYNNGLWLTICDGNKEPLSIAVPLTNALKENETNLLEIEMLSGITEYPKDGYIALTIANPTSPAYFSKTISGTFTAKADNADPQTAEATFTISPIPTVYTIHFRDVNDEWKNPHIYVYQPLEYNGYEVYGKGNSEDTNHLNWLEYSFTGNLTFKGWVKDGGNVPDLTIGTSSFGNGEGVTVTGYNVGTDWGNPSKDDGMIALKSGKEYYTHDITLIDYSKSSCSTCSSGSLVDLWPGIGMTKEIINGETWWRIELPLLAKPDKALVMFANNHRGSTSDDKEKRYPGVGVPGLPLPNYSDREAWFLYDSSSDNHEFSDNRPKVAPNYAFKNITLRGNFDGTSWYDDDKVLKKTTDANGLVKFSNVKIPANGEFKIFDDKDVAYSTGGNITANGTWISVGKESNVMKITGANNNTRYDVEWDQQYKKIKVTLVSGGTTRKAALYWHENDFGGATQMCLYTNKDNNNWKPFYPVDGSWQYQQATISGEFRYIIFSTADELAAFDKLIDTSTSSGYEWSQDNHKWWSEGAHSSKRVSNELPDFLKNAGVTEAYQIW